MKKSILLILICSSGLFAQLSDQQYLNTYKEAVKLFEEEKFEDAYNKLVPLTNRNYTNAVAPYAYLYGALAAENKGNKYHAKILYRSLFQYYPDWDKTNDAKLLYAKNNLADGYFEEGLKAIHEIDDEKYKGLKNAILEEYVKNIKTIAALKNLYNKYPNYKPLAKALVDKIQANRYNSKADLELSDMLTNRFTLTEPAKGNTPKSKPTTSQSNAKGLNFGILLPFETASPQLANGSSRYIYDIYAGMQLAAEKLNGNGISIALHAYDVKSDVNMLKNAEKKEGFSKMNLVVGPLYPATNTPAQKFINENNMIQVHPTSNNLSLLEDSKNAFLMQPSHAYQSKKAFDYIIADGQPKSVSIYFGDARKDSLFAAQYRLEAKKRGFTVNEFRRFTTQKLKADRGHIFYAGDNNAGVKFLQNLAANNVKSQIMITAGSFNWDKVNTDVFSDNVSIIYPEYVNREKEAVKEFEKNYFEKTGAFPSYYSYLGYDLVYYFGSTLKDGRDIFNINIGLGEYTDEYMLSGYDFSEKIKQNIVVPVVKFRYGNFEEVYR